MVLPGYTSTYFFNLEPYKVSLDIFIVKKSYTIIIYMIVALEASRKQPLWKKC